MVGLSQIDQARQSHALQQCASCPKQISVPHFEVNPQGLKLNHLWQMDVTYVAKFGRLKYVHVAIDTYSGFLMATAQTGEATKQVIAHCLKCFSLAGVPAVIKT